MRRFDPTSAHAVILNPKANAGRGSSRWCQFLHSDLAREKGLWNAELFDGTGAGGLQGLDSWISRQLLNGARNFVAAGGDGTVNLAVNSVLRARANLGLQKNVVKFGAIGLGSSNDFQKPFAKPGRNTIGEVSSRIEFGEARAHDIGHVAMGWNGASVSSRHFIINASVGVTAEANWNFNQAGKFLGVLKRNWVDGAIVATALRTFATYKNFPVRIRIDEGPARDVMVTNVGVVKNVHFSGQMHYDIPQSSDDGRFGVHLCVGMSPVEMLRALGALNSGKFKGLPKSESHQAAQIEITANQPFALEADGEVIQTPRAEFRALRKELWVCP